MGFLIYFFSAASEEHLLPGIYSVLAFSLLWASLLSLTWHLERIQGEIWPQRWVWHGATHSPWLLTGTLCQPLQEYTLTAVIYYCVIMPVCLITDFEFYQAACPLVSGNQLLWSTKKHELLCQTLLINWERVWVQLQVALRKSQRALSTLLSSSQYELGTISKSHSLHRAKLLFKDCATVHHCTWTSLHLRTAELSRSLSNDNSREQDSAHSLQPDTSEENWKAPTLYCFFFCHS